MCVVSMVFDHYRDKWAPYVVPNTTITVWPPIISPEEVAEFRRLLDRAREYDRRNNEPECELQEKRDALKKIAEQLGIDISFVE